MWDSGLQTVLGSNGQDGTRQDRSPAGEESRVVGTLLRLCTTKDMIKLVARKPSLVYRNTLLSDTLWRVTATSHEGKP